MKKRREIIHWISYQNAKQDYECDYCGGRISAYSHYCRRVFALKKRFEIERRHQIPDCENRCYT